MKNQHDQEEGQNELETRKFLGLNDYKEDLQKNKIDSDNFSLTEKDTYWEDLGLDQKLIDVLTFKGFKKPSHVQKRVILLSKKNHNILAQSQNGSGKTLAYLIPCIMKLDCKQQGVNDKKQKTPQIIILADTKALIQQVTTILRSLLSDYEGYKDLIVDSLFSGKQDLNEEVHILICTCAQLQKALSKKWISIDQLKMLIIDEADHVFEFTKASNFFTIFVNKTLADKDYQLLFTSATVTEQLTTIVDKIRQKKNIVSFELKAEQLTLKNVYQFMITYQNIDQKIQILEKLIDQLEVQNILIFGNNKKRLFNLQERLQQKNYKAEFIYSSEQNKNFGEALDQKIKDFLSGKFRILLTTNLLSRGIDMRKVTLVVNYSLPLKFFDDKTAHRREIDFETYLHRVGRTGRFGDRGIAINLVDNRFKITIKMRQEKLMHKIFKMLIRS